MIGLKILHYSRDAFKIMSKPFDSFVKNRVMRKKLQRIALWDRVFNICQTFDSDQLLVTLGLFACVSADPGSAPSAGSLAIVGKDRASSGHEVLSGEAVQLLGKPTKHLLLRPATSQKCVD